MKIKIKDKNNNDAVVDTETATISELNDAYTYLLMMSVEAARVKASAIDWDKANNI